MFTVIKTEPHSVNGKKYGMFYHFSGGDCLYLAWRSGSRTKGFFVKRNAWCLDVSTLREAESRGCKYVGVAHKVGSRINYYLTSLSDFFGEQSEPHYEGSTPQRRLNRELFIINTTKRSDYISKSLKIR